MKLREIIFIILSPLLFILGIVLLILGYYLAAVALLAVTVLLIIAQVFLLPYYLIKKPPKHEGRNYGKIRIKSL